MKPRLLSKNPLPSLPNGQTGKLKMLFFSLESAPIPPPLLGILGIIPYELDRFKCRLPTERNPDLHTSLHAYSKCRLTTLIKISPLPQDVSVIK